MLDWTESIHLYDPGTAQILSTLHMVAALMSVLAAIPGLWLAYHHRIVKKRKLFIVSVDRCGIRPNAIEGLTAFLTGFTVVDFAWHAALLTDVGAPITGAVLQSLRYGVGYAGLVMYSVGIIYSIPHGSSGRRCESSGQGAVLSASDTSAPNGGSVAWLVRRMKWAAQRTARAAGAAVRRIPIPAPPVLDIVLLVFLPSPTLLTAGLVATHAALVASHSSNSMVRGITTALWVTWAVYVALFAVVLAVYGHKLASEVEKAARETRLARPPSGSLAKSASQVWAGLQTRSGSAHGLHEMIRRWGRSINASERQTLGGGASSTAVMPGSPSSSLALPSPLSQMAPLLAPIPAASASHSEVPPLLLTDYPARPSAALPAIAAGSGGDNTKPISMRAWLLETSRLDATGAISPQDPSSALTPVQTAPQPPPFPIPQKRRASLAASSTGASGLSPGQSLQQRRRQLQASLMEGAIRRMRITFSVLPVAALMFASVNLVTVAALAAHDTGVPGWMFWIPSTIHIVSGSGTVLVVLGALAWETWRSLAVQEELKGGVGGGVGAGGAGGAGSSSTAAGGGPGATTSKSMGS
ncbi:hypothetical protein BC828DRAFT_383056 [Blastocladiella britannica]|nr:hypothetical protein BC828DRAFT_383056 [Blastocladiella britannica]